MRTSKILNLVLAASLLGVVYMTIVPTAAAQLQQTETPTLTVKVASQTADQELRPLQAPVTLKGEITFSSQGNARSSLTGVSIDLTAIGKPSWATVVINPATIVLNFEGTPEGSTAVNGKETFDVIVTASQEAPAYQDAEILIQAASRQSSAFAAANAKAPATIRASYFSIIDVVLTESIKAERPLTSVTFPIKVTNFGNGPTKVAFKVLTTPVNPKLQVIPPNPIQLESRQAGGTAIAQDVALQVQTPYKNGYMNEPETIVLEVTSAYAFNSKLTGDTNQVAMLITTRGFYVPGPSPLLMFGFVALAAVVMRRLRA